MPDCWWASWQRVAALRRYRVLPAGSSDTLPVLVRSRAIDVNERLANALVVSSHAACLPGEGRGVQACACQGLLAVEVLVEGAVADIAVQVVAVHAVLLVFCAVWQAQGRAIWGDDETMQPSRGGDICFLIVQEGQVVVPWGRRGSVVSPVGCEGGHRGGWGPSRVGGGWRGWAWQEAWLPCGSDGCVCILGAQRCGGFSLTCSFSRVCSCIAVCGCALLQQPEDLGPQLLVPEPVPCNGMKLFMLSLNCIMRKSGDRSSLCYSLPFFFTASKHGHMYVIVRLQTVEVGRPAISIANSEKVTSSASFSCCRIPEYTAQLECRLL